MIRMFFIPLSVTLLIRGFFCRLWLLLLYPSRHLLFLLTLAFPFPGAGSPLLHSLNLWWVPSGCHSWVASLGFFCELPSLFLSILLLVSAGVHGSSSFCFQSSFFYSHYPLRCLTLSSGLASYAGVTLIPLAGPFPYNAVRLAHSGVPLRLSFLVGIPIRGLLAFACSFRTLV